MGFISGLTASAQQIKKQEDSTLLKTRILDSITHYTYIYSNIVKPISNNNDPYIFSGKKTEQIQLTQSPADITNKSGRQVFAKVPGIFVYEMDGAGNQVNIAARGLDPHRGWEFNLRKDGIITNSDMYGYPASHYSMPLESIEKIEIVRGTGSLQYGAQFGGMVNYVTKKGDTTRPFSFESINTTGSYNLLSTYNAVGGKWGSLQYYAYYHKKSRDGYRQNEHTNSEAQSIMLLYEVAKNISIKAEWARSTYLYRIPGPLNDSMFYTNPRQATRSRNYFSPDIHIPSLTLNWHLSASAQLQLITSLVLGKRNSVLFDKPANIADTINTTTLQYNNRQVDIDRFNSRTAELRLLQQYSTGSYTSTIVAGIQYMNNHMHRTQLGKGTTGSDYDLTLVSPGWGRDMHFKTQNIALFAENKLQLSRKLSLNTGFRIEAGQTDMNGILTYYPIEDIPVTIKHQFPLFGASLSYKAADNVEYYAGFAQSYRPMIFKDLVPTSIYEKVDPNIKDSKGFNAEIGSRGNWKFLRWDITGFLLQYNNRFGTLALTDAQNNFYTYRTNTGNSVNAGAEILLQANWRPLQRLDVSLFTSTAFNHAVYTNAMVKSGNQNINIKGNKVEGVPNLITRNGISVRYRALSYSVLYSYTGQNFADPLNTVEPLKTTGAVGLVPAYGLWDMNFTLRLPAGFEVRANLNNVFNKQYFTKRPLFYPGPGVWPGDGRNGSVTIVIRM